MRAEPPGEDPPESPKKRAPKWLENGLNGFAVVVLSYTAIIVTVGVVAAVFNPDPELRRAVAGVLATLAGIVLCILGFVWLGRRR